MSSMRDCTNICTEKSSELRKFWNCTMNAVCSSSLLSAKLILEASKIARREPSFKTTMPSRTSETGTKSCVDFVLAAARFPGIYLLSNERFTRRSYRGDDPAQVLFIFADTSCDPLINIERPGKVVKPRFRKLRNIHFRVFLYIQLFLFDGFFGATLVVPEVEFGMNEKVECVLDGDDERSSVIFQKCERSCPARDRENDGRGKKKRQKAPCNVGSTESAENIDELFEGQRPKDLVLHFNELWNLELHTLLLYSAMGAPGRFLLKLVARDTDHHEPSYVHRIPLPSCSSPQSARAPLFLRFSAQEVSLAARRARKLLFV